MPPPYSEDNDSPLSRFTVHVDSRWKFGDFTVKTPITLLTETDLHIKKSNTLFGSGNVVYYYLELNSNLAVLKKNPIAKAYRRAEGFDLVPRI